MNKRINIVGYYGWGNFGDELFRKTVTLHAETFWGKGSIARTYLLPSSRIRQSSSPIGSAIRLCEAVIGTLLSSKTVFCGGSVFSRLTRTQRLRFQVSSRRRSFEALGVSLGPWESEKDRRECVERLLAFDRVLLRDQASNSRAGTSFQVACDLAALYPMEAPTQVGPRKLTFCPSRDAGLSGEEISALLLQHRELLGSEIVLLALNSSEEHGDIPLCLEIQTILAGQNIICDIVKFENVDQTIEILANSLAVWSQRLHGLIVAYLCSVPVYAFSHHKKITDFCTEIGLPRSGVLESGTVSDANILHARSTLIGDQNWTVEPATYIAHARQLYFEGQEIL